MIVPTAPAVGNRSAPVDAAKTAAIFGTILIHASAMGGFAWETGSTNWVWALFWGSVLRCAVPVFFLCSGALLLDPEKNVTVRRVWTHYIPRIAAALFFWAAAYGAWPVFLTWLGTGVVEAEGLWMWGRICSSGVTRPISITCTSSCWCTPCCPSPGSLPPGRTGN